jgi:hypothetical protein
MLTNDLYLTVLPLVHVTPNQVMGYGLTEQTLTLFPDPEFATLFFPDEVDAYIEIFQSRAEKYLSGGHVKGYQFFKLPGADGKRLIVKVIQSVE